ncbi:3-hexulose-6-phosphate synthase [Aggregatilinea lenta]|uniref:3-hexulose-6-phosphate synthase n=1 Tax=Aggregatilinea lenta TaxID=913108 RepID=UPI0013C32990|nr:3-hexulose-6-phosphate synthase [Aggregatilinea lenta]
MPDIRLQLALDGTLDAARSVLAATHPYIDVIEIGTPLIFREGVAAVRWARETYPDKGILADLKIMDAGEEEASIAFEAGAMWVTVLGAAADATVNGVVHAARRCGGQVMADLVQVADPLTRGRALLALGCDVLCVHTAYDMQGLGHTPLAALRALREHLPGAQLAAAGGITPHTLTDILSVRPAIVVVGGAVTRAHDPAQAARALRERMEAG